MIKRKFAEVALAPLRPEIQRTALPQTQRHFSTGVARHHSQSPLLHIEHSVASGLDGLDDGFIPFVPESSMRQPDSPPRTLPSTWPSSHAGVQRGHNTGDFETVGKVESSAEPSIELHGAIDVSEHRVNLLTSRLDDGLHVSPSEDELPSGEETGRKIKEKNSAKSSTTKIRTPFKDTIEQPSKQTTETTKDSPGARVRSESWQIYKEGLKQKLGDQAWNPRKRVSPDAMEGIRAMHAQYPNHFTTPVLAKQFELSPDAIRRILKGKWKPSTEEEESRRQRWDKRGERIWTNLVEQGVHPPKRWRMMGIGGGPRRPAQDRKLQKAIKEGRATSVGMRAARGNSWMQSLADRMG